MIKSFNVPTSVTVTSVTAKASYNIGKVTVTVTVITQLQLKYVCYQRHISSDIMFQKILT